MSVGTNFFDICMDSPSCVAGERFSGEILLQLPHITKEHSIHLNSKGAESVKIKSSSGQIEEHSALIYTLNSKLPTSFTEGDFQGVFPFTFKLPLYSPSSFDFSEIDSEGNLITIEVSYEIEAVLCVNNSQQLSVHKKIYVLNRNTRRVLTGTVQQEKSHSCCMCCGRANSKIELGYLNREHLICGGIKQYSARVLSELNQSLSHLIYEVIFQVYIQTPDGKAFNITKVLSRSNIEPQDLIKKTENPNDLKFEVEADIRQDNAGKNPSSNNGSLFAAEYKIEVSADYTLGCGNERNTCSLKLHVNPEIPLKESIKLPENWQPIENLIANLILEYKDFIHSSQSSMIEARPDCE